jgi:hypothetical protein
MGAPNFTLLDSSLPEIGRLISAMLRVRDAVERRLWSHPQEPTGEEWWADVLADPRQPAAWLGRRCSESIPAEM